MQRFVVYLCALTLADCLAVAQKNGGSGDRMNALQANNGQDRISREVRHELVTLPYYGVFDNLAYSVNGGVVTLYGQVTNSTLKSDAGNVVKKIEGVTKVENQIEVLPLSPMDDQIRRAEYRAVYGDSVLSTRYGFQALPSIHIIVKNGHVRLEGVVANSGDKNIVN